MRVDEGGGGRGIGEFGGDRGGEEEEWREIMEGEESLKEKKQLRFGGQRRNRAPKEDMMQEE